MKCTESSSRLYKALPHDLYSPFGSPTLNWQRCGLIKESKGKSSSTAGGSQRVSLQGDVREAEVSRGLGIEASPSDDSDALEEDVRNIWVGELQKIKRELKAQDAFRNAEDVLRFDDAVES